MKDDGTIDVAAGKHLNGRPDGFAGHPANWMTKGDTDFHGQAVVRTGRPAASAATPPTRPARVSAISCATCHDMLAGGDWTKSCAGCHGSAVNAAPPKDTHRNTATTARGVGAHQSHVTGSHGIAAPIDCVVLPPEPVDVFAQGHMDGTVQLTGYTGSNGAIAALLPSQGWDAAAATCTNYCHGATLDGGAAPRPIWTKVDGTQGACGSCHGLPGARHLALAPGATAATCAPCHATTVRSDGSIDVASGKHLNGQIDAFGGHPAGWMDAMSPDFHGKPGHRRRPGMLHLPRQVAAGPGSRLHVLGVPHQRRLGRLANALQRLPWLPDERRASARPARQHRHHLHRGGRPPVAPPGHARRGGAARLHGVPPQAHRGAHGPAPRRARRGHRLHGE